MAWQLGEGINLKWSKKRFEQEHNRLQEEVNNVLLNGPDRPLKIATKFNEHHLPGCKLIETTGELLAEANAMKHCVASYLNKIELGQCAIYHLDHEGEPTTIEVGTFLGDELEIRQIKGFRNAKASNEALQAAKEALAEANSGIPKKERQFEYIEDEDGLPF